MTMKLIKNNLSLNVMYSGHLNTAFPTEKWERGERVFLISIGITKSVKFIIIFVPFLFNVRKNIYYMQYTETCRNIQM